MNLVFHLIWVNISLGLGQKFASSGGCAARVVSPILLNLAEIEPGRVGTTGLPKFTTRHRKGFTRARE